MYYTILMKNANNWGNEYTGTIYTGTTLFSAQFFCKPVTSTK